MARKSSARNHLARAPRNPIRATSMWRVDQVFLSRKGQRIEVVSSLVNEQGGLRNIISLAPTEEPLEAVRYAARAVAGMGNVYEARNARVRWARAQSATAQAELIRDYDLEDEYLDSFLETLDIIRDQMG